MNRIHLVVIDPQNDFCDPQGALASPGGDGAKAHGTTSR